MYILVFCLLILVYVCFIFLLKKFTNIKLTNLAFCLVAFCLYIALTVIILLEVGPNDWNFTNALPVSNVSPFVFFVSPIYLILPKQIKRYYLTLISLLSVGMFVSPLLSCLYYAIVNYNFVPQFLLDFVAHLSISLWGIYIVITNQTVDNKRDVVLSGSIIVAVAVIMLIFNVIFDKSFFGLSLNGKHNIYNFILVSNSYLSAIIYFVGLISTLIIGYFCTRLLAKIINRPNSHIQTQETVK